MAFRSNHKRPSERPGFTLLETALATVIIGVGVLAMVEAQASFSRTNDFSTSAATANYLANELRERMRALPRHDPVTGLYFRTVNGTNSLQGWGPEAGELAQQDYDDLDDFDGVSFGVGGTFAGPISSRGEVLSELGADGSPILDDQSQPVSLRGWVQTVTVEKLDPQNFSNVRDDGYVRAAVPPNFPGLTVDQFPLRVTISVSLRSPLDGSVQEMGRVVFIAP